MFQARNFLNYKYSGLTEKFHEFKTAFSKSGEFVKFQEVSVSMVSRLDGSFARPDSAKVVAWRNATT